MAQMSVHVSISGRVQGVGFRAWVRDNAIGLGLAGWVRNRRSGTVEAVFCGDKELVETMLRACRTGPRWSRVDELQVLPDGKPVKGGFSVRETA